MASGGYLKLYRDLLGSDMWQLSDSHLRVMFGLMMLVNWRAANWRCHRCKTTIEVLPGETCMSRSSLAGRIGCSPRVLDRAIGHMIEAGFVAKVGGNKCGSDKSRACHTHIRLINWEKYQSEEKRIVAGGNDPGTQTVTATVPRRSQRRYSGRTTIEEPRTKNQEPRTSSAREGQASLGIDDRPRRDIWAIADALRATVQPPISDKRWSTLGKAWYRDLQKAVDREGDDAGQLLEAARTWEQHSWVGGIKDGERKISDARGLLRHYRRVLAERPRTSGGYCREDIPES